jgi:hypothetical protein
VADILERRFIDSEIENRIGHGQNSLERISVAARYPWGGFRLIIP